MAEAIVSPGVFTNERDLSFLPTGIASIGAAIVGTTSKGPAFVPTIITKYEDFKAMYGGTTDDAYVPHAVKAYLQAASSVTVVRVVQEGGYFATPVLVKTGSTVLGALYLTTTIGQSSASGVLGLTIGAATSVSTSFGLSGSVGNTAVLYSASLLPASANSLINQFGRKVVNSKPFFNYIWAGNYITRNSGSIGAVTFNTGSVVDYSTGTYGAYRAAATPWITSKIVAGVGTAGVGSNLFKFHHLGDGEDGNTAVKISVINTALPGQVPGSDYGTFNVLVRAFSDTDQRPEILETFTNLSLDPDSTNFIARRIGDRAYSVDSTGLVTSTGDYENVSKYIRVSVATDVSKGTISANLCAPFGFAAIFNPLSGSSNLLPNPVLATNSGSGVPNYISSTLNNTEINASYNKKAFYGWNFAESDNDNFLKAIPVGGIAHPSGGFNLDWAYIHPDATATSAQSTFAASRIISASVFSGLDVSNVLRFTVPLQDGFNGMDPAIPKNVGEDITGANVFGMNCASVAASGSKAFIKALNTLSNADEYDINLIAVPGINAVDHLPILEKAIEVAEERGDTFVAIDPVTLSTSGGVGAAISAISNGGFDTSYAAAYWPWVKVRDTERDKLIWLPASAVMPGVIANSDAKAFEWFSPAGLNRGGIANAVDAEYKLTQAQRGELYEARINAIADFPNEGVVVWGQKTLQAKASALDRVNVRRLMISLKKYIASASRYLVFENNTTSTRARFVNIVTPYLETVKARNGLYAFKVVMDDTNNTPDIIDANKMYGQIWIQPAKAVDFIVLDFNVLRTGASFEGA